MRFGRQAVGTALLTLGLFVLALLVAVPVFGPAAGEALAAVPVKDAAHVAVPAGARAGADTTPPTRPEGTRPCPVPMAPGNPTGYASICWNASTDENGVVGYDLYRLDVGGFVLAATTTGTIGGFSGELNRSYTMYVVARDLSGNVSRPSALITVSATVGMTPTASPTPLPGDRVPPSKPAGLRDACLQDYPGATFCWQPSTDNVAVTAYDVYREGLSGYVKVGTITPPQFLNFAESGLVTGQRYTYVVVARDAAGNLSAPSDPLSALAREGLPSPSPTPTPTPGPSCAVSYDVTSWGSGLHAQITVRNTGTTAIDGWTLTMDYPTSAVRLTSGWSADWSQDGSRLTAANRSWNRVIPAGSSTQIGFVASYSGSLAAPVGFGLDGTACATG
ncbi:cellulose-binding domain-containing protein [Streptosporangium sp. NPDC023615]|uniref:cellulose-binding domain-containing protein n=1 Tax=Streptosporangium sp. NPDC023615 TaxID=3154794 RepID=UPI0034415456